MFPLDGFNPSPYAIPLVVAGTLMLLLGVFAAIRERWSSVGVSFLALTAAISIWFLGHALASSMESAEDTLWWIRSGAQIGATFIPAAVLTFALLVTDRGRRLWPLAAGSIAISLGFYLVSAMTDWFIASTHEYSWGPHPEFGWAGTLFVPYFFLLMGGSLWFLWVERRTAPFRVRRSRATTLLIAFGIGGLAATDFLPAFGLPLYAFGYVPIFGFIAIAAWAIWRYRLVDITPALAAERILTAMSDALIVVDRDGRIQVCNQAARELLGNGGVRLEGTLATDMLPGLPFLATPEALERHGQVQHHETAFQTAQGDQRVLRISASLMYDAAGDPLAAICLAADITSLKATEQALHDANLRLEDAIQQLKDAQEDVLHRERLRALGRMASGVAHDFNNALVPILGYAELLHGDPVLLKDETRANSYLEQIIKAAGDARNNIARMRHLYRPRDEATQPLDLNELVEQTLAATRPLWQGQTWASGGNVTIETDFAPVPLVLGGEAELGEAITNLIINAVDAMPSGGTIHMRTSFEEGRAVLAISDTGTGMSAEVLERCQEPFFSTKGARGTGLGLAVVAQTVERHEGKLEITSREGQGTTVRMRFPAHQGASKGQGMPVVSGAGPLPAMRVLLVDDEPAPREVLYQYLTRDGHAVEACASGAEALAKFHEQPFDLVLTDLAMPGMSGLQLASAVKNARPSVPILLITGFGTASLSDNGGGSKDGSGEEHVDLVLAKPVTRDGLRNALRALVQRAPASC